MAGLDQEALQAELKKKRICRFCLNQDVSKITNIYMRDTRIKSSAPLPIQIMAIASIEVFSNDGMPSFVCSDCTNMFEYSYQFKQMCKKADNLLRQYPLTGKWPACLDKPILPTSKLPQYKTTQVRVQQINKNPVKQEPVLPKKILNTYVNSKKIVSKVEKPDEECSITFLDKIENNEELSLDDIHQLVAAEDIRGETEFVKMDNLPLVVVDSGNIVNKPKLLNKSSVRILNKEAEAENEPRLSLPKIKQDVDGKTEIVAEILNIEDIYEEEPDPANAVPIETNVYSCEFCERTFPLLQLRDIHMKNHSRERKFQCEFCEKSFYSKYDLIRHSFIHNGEKPFTCSVCGKGFSRSSLLSRHEKTHTDVPKYICIHCERSFLSKDDMEKHAERHNINRPFVCKICKKGFAFKQGLERHEVVHSRDQPFSCQYCDQSFSTTTKLSRHLTAHAGIRPYPCKYCRKSYLLSHHLTRHLRSHKNVVDHANAISFMCMSCETSFESRDELIKHSTSHANEINLACPLCKDVFDSMIELTSHIQDHSEGEAYACEFCDLIFLTADKLQAHTDSDHTQEMEAYHADDRATADKQMNQQNDADIADEKLQNAVNDFLSEDLSNEGNESESLLKKNTEKEAEQQSPKIINQIIIQSPVNNPNYDKQIENSNSLLIPLKQRKIEEVLGKKIITQAKPTQQTKQSPQLRRRIPNAEGAPAKMNLNKSADNETLDKFTINVAVTKTSQAKTPPFKTPPLKTRVSKPIKVEENLEVIPKVIKVENEFPTSSSSATTETRKVKVQKITVTKAQAAAMAKQGRIKIKDGKIILKK